MLILADELQYNGHFEYCLFILEIIISMGMVICKSKTWFMKAGLRLVSIKELVNWYCQIRMFMLVNLVMDNFLGKDNMCGLMEIFIKEPIKKAKDKV
jgi:hypothetical protein